MLKITSSLVIFSTLLCGTVCHGQSIDSPKVRLKFRIAINQGKWEKLQYSGVNLQNREVLQSLQSQIITRLTKSGWFEVLEREDSAWASTSNEVEKDKERRDQSSIALPKRNPLVSADFIITPELVEFSASSKKDNRGSFGGINFGKTESRCSLSLNMRISSTETTAVFATATGSAEKKESGDTLGVKIAGVQSESSSLGSGLISKTFDEALGKIVDDLISQVSKLPWQATVAAITEETKQVVLNKGFASGVAVGMIFDLMKVGKPIIDPVTGVSIAPGEEIKVGSVKVVRVLANAAFCEYSGNQSPKTGQLVRLPSGNN